MFCIARHWWGNNSQLRVLSVKSIDLSANLASRGDVFSADQEKQQLIKPQQELGDSSNVTTYSSRPV